MLAKYQPQPPTDQSGQIIATSHDQNPQNVAFWKGSLLTSGKSRLVKYYNLARSMVTLWFIFLFKAQKGQIHSFFLHWDEGSYPSNMMIHTSATNKSLRIFDFFLSNIRLMAEILHQLIGSLSHYLQGFIHPRWLAGFLPSTVSFSKNPWMC